MKYFFQYILVRILSAFLTLLPYSWMAFIVRRTADIIYLLSGSRRRIAIENVTRAFGDSISLRRKKEIVRHSIQNIALSIVELVTIRRYIKKCHEYFTFVGAENYFETEKYGKGTVLGCAHTGSWELLSFFYFMNKRRASVIVKEIRNAYINGWIDKARRETDLNPIPKNASIREIFKVLKRNETIAILIDQWAGREGIWINFFKDETSTTTLPARIALKTGAPIVPAFCFRDKKNKLRIELLAPIYPDNSDPGAAVNITRQLNKILEDKIMEYPEQWTWSHRRWKPKPQDS